jgi:hypothetical protein
MKKYTISISLFDRPEYTKILFDNLNKCIGIDKYHILISCDNRPDNSSTRHGPLNGRHKIVQNIAKQFRPNQTVVFNDQILGCNNNIIKCINLGFSINNDFHIHLEDDTIPAKDFLCFCEWAREKYRDNVEIFTVTGYNKINNIDNNYIDKVIKDQYFNGWGWATWFNRLSNINLADQNIRKLGWDVYLHTHVRQNRYQIKPLIPRIQNIGAKFGEHVISEKWHSENHYNEKWIETIQAYTNNFEEINT